MLSFDPGLALYVLFCSCKSVYIKAYGDLSHGSCNSTASGLQRNKRRFKVRMKLNVAGKLYVCITR